MVGIIVAMEEEYSEIKKYMHNIREEEQYGMVFFIGQIGKCECVLTISGIGKVNSARTTQMLIDKYNPQYIINTGVAGGISRKVNIGNIVVAEKISQYDFDLTAFGREKGEVSDKIGKFIYCDTSLVNKANNIIKNVTDVKGINGIVASGDRFVTKEEFAKEINKEFGADCVEMEGAAIGQVCTLSEVPFIVIRSISDSPNDNNKVDYEHFLNFASKNVAQFVNKFLE